ncbi:hypothetical protein NSK_005823 [Nannochloropsis salina CCMP1776]|uniref:Uncharacterized protein n=1 Tax=Nannochloropsis salina CCMP1776 TaxID=1027361 RepID=A0A4D9CUI0_9STRA|nr:hypothetical protein NSK_005823 [Nannochloropsis salina CCMP1776]|eukprot:TFJ82870.1 hypothetical protein NSK_005823 [Nannochloropsis salina CCMP1776]
MDISIANQHLGLLLLPPFHPSPPLPHIDTSPPDRHAHRPHKPLVSSFTHGANAYDYVNDVAWCPSHPCIFASVSSGGLLGLWNLNHSSEAPFLPLFPVTGYVAEKSASPTPTRGLSAPAGSSQIGNRSLFPPSIPPSSPPVALTRLAWTGDGKRLAVGDTSGRIHVLRMAEELIRPRKDEDMRLEETLFSQEV